MINFTSTSSATVTAGAITQADLNSGSASAASATDTPIVSRRASGRQSSTGETQSYELSTQTLAGEVMLIGDINLLTNPSLELAGTLELQPTFYQALASTARRNIVLKLREDLYGQIAIDDFKNEVTQVEGTTDFRGLLTEDQVASTPAVFVMRLRTQSTANQTLGYEVRQQVEDYFGILLVADNVTDEYGVNSMDIIWALHTKIVDSLLGWQLPTTEFDRPTMPLTYRGGTAYGLELDSYHWLDQFSCASQICSYRNRPKPVTF